MKKNLKRREYGCIRKEKRREILKVRMEGIIAVAAAAAFFYRSVWAVPFLLPLFFLYCKGKHKELCRKEKKITQLQFSDAILSVSANLKAGYSVENSFRIAYEDMAALHGKESIICKELSIIRIGLSNNITLESLLFDFGERSAVEDIAEFAEVFAAAKRNGGNMTEIIERSASVIEGKAETEKEIELLLTARRLEQKIMNIVPFAILIYIGITSKGFFDALYHNAAGVIVMSICLCLYLTAIAISRKIVAIEV